MKKGFGLVGVLIVIGIIAFGGGGYYYSQKTDDLTEEYLEIVDNKTPKVGEVRNIVYRETDYKKIEGKEYPTWGDRIGDKDVEVILKKGDYFDYLVSFKTNLNRDTKTFVGYIGSSYFDFNIDPNKEIGFKYSEESKYCSINNTEADYKNIRCLENKSSFYTDVNDLNVCTVKNTQCRASLLKIRGLVSEIEEGNVIIDVKELIQYTQ